MVLSSYDNNETFPLLIQVRDMIAVYILIRKSRSHTTLLPVMSNTLGELTWTKSVHYNTWFVKNLKCISIVDTPSSWTGFGVNNEEPTAPN